VALVLGDNIFYGSHLQQLVKEHNDPEGGVIFAYHVSDPQHYGVVEFDEKQNVVSIEENPKIQNQIMLFPVCISMIIPWWKRQKY